MFLNMPKIIGHRGIKALAPENTINSILKAIELVPGARTFSFEGGHNIINSRTKEIVSLINDFKSSYLND